MPSSKVVEVSIAAGQEAFAERAERHEPDAELFARPEHVVLGAAPPQGVLALDRGHRLDGVGAADGVGRRLGQPVVLDLAGLDQLFDCAGELLDRHVGVDSVLVVQVDAVDAEALQGAVDRTRAASSGVSIRPRDVAFDRVDVLCELGGDDDPVAERAPALRPTSSSFACGP